MKKCIKILVLIIIMSMSTQISLAQSESVSHRKRIMPKLEDQIKQIYPYGLPKKILTEGETTMTFEMKKGDLIICNYYYEEDGIKKCKDEYSYIACASLVPSWDLGVDYHDHPDGFPDYYYSLNDVSDFYNDDETLDKYKLYKKEFLNNLLKEYKDANLPIWRRGFIIDTSSICEHTIAELLRDGFNGRLPIASRFEDGTGEMSTIFKWTLDERGVPVKCEKVFYDYRNEDGNETFEEFMCTETYVY